MLVYRTIRSHELCKGGTEGGHQCENANDVTCTKCGLRRTVEDTGAPGLCPECGERVYRVERCSDCPVGELEHVRSHSRAGRLVDRILQLEFDSKYFSVPWSEVNAEEVKALEIMKDERESFKAELAKRSPNGLPN